MVPSGLDTLGGLVYTLNQRGVFSVTADPNMKSAVKSEDLADVPSQDIKSSPYTLLKDKTRLMTDEMGWSMAWMNANLTGLPAQRVYMYPGSYEDTSTEAIAVSGGFSGSRGSGRDGSGAERGDGHGYGHRCAEHFEPGDGAVLSRA